ncbi:MAG: hypothetical protein H7122_16620 [Chitinophagaceae bacterium]|nr:hypothetical protein [Chitinophagaceae bacterium]
MYPANSPNTEISIDPAIRFNKYLPVAILYFFLNSFLLPHGLLYTTLLTPVFIIWLYKYPSFKYVWYFFPFIALFVTVHLINGVNIKSYAISFFLLFSVYVFAVAFHRFLKECNSLRSIYRNILVINSACVIMALIALVIPFLTSAFWHIGSISSGIESMKRLKLLTYEASYYSTLLAPVALYYYLKLIILKLPNPYIVAFLLSVPLILSLSFGVLLALALSLLLTLLAGFRTFFPNKNLPVYIIISGIILIVLFITFVQLFPGNVLVQRLNNVLAGTDTSFRGRTTDSFFLGFEVASLKNLWFGVGPGQVKEVGLDIFRDFYDYDAFLRENVRIPNSLGDTLATFGIIGVAIRMFAEVYLFFKTRVWSNYYRLSLFLFIFIYQFTGSYLTNIAEYVIWILAFHRGLFTEFDKVAFKVNSISISRKDPQS